MQKARINHQIRAAELRVIGHDGANLGLLQIQKALEEAEKVGLDLVEISPTANPPVAKIMDSGKYFYEQEKKSKQATKKRKEVELKSVRIGIGTGIHDLELKAKQGTEFLKGGNKIKIDLALRGREKYLDKKFLEERIRRFLSIIPCEFTEEPIKKGPRGLSITIEPKK